MGRAILSSELWRRKRRDCGILSDAPEDFAQSAPHKVELQQLRELWGQYCLVVVSRESFSCSCPIQSDEGHCPHGYSCFQIAVYATYVGRALPVAAVGAAALRAGGSSEDEAPVPSPKRTRRGGTSGVVANASRSGGGSGRAAARSGGGTSGTVVGAGRGQGNAQSRKALIDREPHPRAPARGAPMKPRTHPFVIV